MIEREFFALTRDMRRSHQFRAMRKYRHHVKGSVYDHTLKAAYLCYRHHKRFGGKIPLDEFVRGAMLHDYYLYDWHDRLSGHRLHCFTHPRTALHNALTDYPTLTAAQQDMILRHMFPLIPSPPRTAAGWLLCLYDKIAAISDYLGKNRWKLRYPKEKENQRGKN